MADDQQPVGPGLGSAGCGSGARSEIGPDLAAGRRESAGAPPPIGFGFVGNDAGDVEAGPLTDIDFTQPWFAGSLRKTQEFGSLAGAL